MRSGRELSEGEWESDEEPDGGETKPQPTQPPRSPAPLEKPAKSVMVKEEPKPDVSTGHGIQKESKEEAASLGEVMAKEAKPDVSLGDWEQEMEELLSSAEEGEEKPAKSVMVKEEPKPDVSTSHGIKKESKEEAASLGEVMAKEAKPDVSLGDWKQEMEELLSSAEEGEISDDEPNKSPADGDLDVFHSFFSNLANGGQPDGRAEQGEESEEPSSPGLSDLSPVRAELVVEGEEEREDAEYLGPPPKPREMFAKAEAVKIRQRAVRKGTLVEAEGKRAWKSLRSDQHAVWYRRHEDAKRRYEQHLAQLPQALAPKPPPLNSYMIFLNANKERIKATLGDSVKKDCRALGSAAGKEWGALSDTARQHWYTQYKERKAAFLASQKGKPVEPAPLTPFFLYMHANKARILEKVKVGDGGARGLSTIAAAEWHALSKDQKAVWVDKYKKNQRRYAGQGREGEEVEAKEKVVPSPPKLPVVKESPMPKELAMVKEPSTVMESSMVKESPKARDSPKTKTTGPKKPITAFLMFMQANLQRLRLLAKQETGDARHGAPVLTRIASREWRSMTREEKWPWTERYQENKRAYCRAHGLPEPQYRHHRHHTIRARRADKEAGPRKPLTPFMMYFQDHKDRLRAEAATGERGATGMTALAAAEWNALSEEAKGPWQERFHLGRLNHQQALAALRLENCAQATARAPHNDPHIDLPDDDDFWPP